MPQRSRACLPVGKFESRRRLKNFDFSGNLGIIIIMDKNENINIEELQNKVRKSADRL